VIGRSNNAQLLRGVDFNGGHAEWRRARWPFSRHIPDGGDVLDVGCGNGFLLVSLLDWQPRRFVPFGFDNRSDRIAEARSLLPRYAHNFWVQDCFDDRSWRQVYDVVFAPWIADDSFIIRCLMHARSRVVFSLYDDELALGMRMIGEGRSKSLDVLAVDRVPGITELLAVRGNAKD
jgi:SAM-dependent methyltransferase